MRVYPLSELLWLCGWLHIFCCFDSRLRKHFSLCSKKLKRIELFGIMSQSDINKNVWTSNQEFSLKISAHLRVWTPFAAMRSQEACGLQMLWKKWEKLVQQEGYIMSTTSFLSCCAFSAPRAKRCRFFGLFSRANWNQFVSTEVEWNGSSWPWWIIVLAGEVITQLNL